MHPLLLLQNTEMERRRDEHGFVTTATPDGPGEYELVIATKQVSVSEHDRGLRFIHGLNALYNARCAYLLSRYLRTHLDVDFAAVCSAFVEYCECHLDNAYVQRINRAISERQYGEHIYWGDHFHYLAHEYRLEFNEFLKGFAESQPWWSEEARTVLELDFLNRPYVYSNTPITLGRSFANPEGRKVDLRSRRLQPDGK